MSSPDLSALLRRLDARAAGLWRVVGAELVQVAFVAASELPRDAADGFAEATRRVSLDRVALGIVRAAMDGRPFVSVAADLPDDRGSGDWLRRFGADRSVAVPIVGDGGRVVGVVSIAMVGLEPAAGEVAAELLRTVATAL